MKQQILKLAGIALIGLSIASCSKDGTPSNPQMKGFMTNSESSTAKRGMIGDTGAFDSTITVINLDVRKVVFKYEDGDGKEIEKDSAIVESTPFQLNLLAFNKDSVMKFLDGEAHVGRLKEIRLILGAENYVIKDSVRHDLKVPSGKSSGVKIKIRGELKSDTENEFTIDFKIRESLKKESDNFVLRPVIKVRINKGTITGEDSDGTDN